MSHLENFDKEIYDLIKLEEERQLNHIELIASENYASKTVIETIGNAFNNKYAEGYSGRRYYGGCIYADQVEDIAISRLKEIFGSECANVQPHSGAQANGAVYLGLINPGDKVLGMDLAHGGHLTHGSPVNMSGKYYEFHSYGVEKETEMIDYDKVRDTAKKVMPRLLVAGASTYPRSIDFKILGDIAKEIGAYFMVDMAHIAGLVAAGVHMSPVPYADIVTLTTHKTMRGPRGGAILMKKEFEKEVNKGVFPGHQGGPLVHTIAAKAVAFKEALGDDFKEYQKQIVKNAKVLSTSLMDKGIRLISNGTDNHLMCIDTKASFGITGKEAEKRLSDVCITANKNAIPFDEEKPMVTSGLRIGTPVVTTRGMKEKDMEVLADIMYKALREEDSQKQKERVSQLVKDFPYSV